MRSRRVSISAHRGSRPNNWGRREEHRAGQYQSRREEDEGPEPTEHSTPLYGLACALTLWPKGLPQVIANLGTITPTCVYMLDSSYVEGDVSRGLFL